MSELIAEGQFPRVAVVLTGAILIVGGLSVALGIFAVIGLALLVVFLVATAVLIHNFWAVEEPGQRMSRRVTFMKNIALAGAALALMYGAAGWPLVILS